MSAPPPPPGWWQAADGRWYPPQPGPLPPYGPPQQQWTAAPPTRPPSGLSRGCVIAAVVVAVVVFAGIALVVYAGSVVVNTVGGIVGGGVIGTDTTSCPTAEDVSGIVGSTVGAPIGGNLVGVAGCTYLSASPGEGLDVLVVSGPDLVADEQLTDFADEGATAGATVAPIPVGDRGQAWASAYKSAAIAVGDGRVVLVEIMPSGSGTLDDRTPAAIALLERVLG
jgi:hypothetical protein